MGILFCVRQMFLSFRGEDVKYSHLSGGWEYSSVVSFSSNHSELETHTQVSGESDQYEVEP